MPALALGGTQTIELRDYQETTLAKSAEAEMRGVRKQLWVLATGLGKTIIFAAHAARRGERTLVIAHRDELIEQAARKVRLVWPDADIGVVKGPRNEVGAQDVVVASVQSLSPRRLTRLGHFGLVVVDEAHHATSASYTRVLETLRAGEVDGPLLVGVTATPSRSDGKGLSQHFDEIVVDYPIVWGIRAGYLTDVRCKVVELADLDLSRVSVRHGDYSEGETGEAMTAANAPWHVVDAWKRWASDRLTASFHPTVANAQDQAAEFQANGIPAACVSGVDLLERRHILRDFEAGRIRVVTNAMVLTEGWDCPPVSCIVMGRPTKSSGLYAQVLGRGLRPYPLKEDCLVLDVVGASSKVDLCSVASLLGVEKRRMAGGKRSVVEALDDQAAAERARQPTTPTGTVVGRDVDLFAKAARSSRISWATIAAGRVFATPAGDDQVVIEKQADDTWTVSVVGRQGASVVMAGVPMDLAQGIAEDHVRRTKVPKVLTDKNAAWRSKPPSANLLAFAAKWHIRIDPSWDAGAVKDATVARIAQVNLAKARKIQKEQSA
jgi:superfamily II DNA or RNA helicase